MVNNMAFKLFQTLGSGVCILHNYPKSTGDGQGLKGPTCIPVEHHK